MFLFFLMLPPCCMDESLGISLRLYVLCYVISTPFGYSAFFVVVCRCVCVCVVGKESICLTLPWRWVLVTTVQVQFTPLTTPFALECFTGGCFPENTQSQGKSFDVDTAPFIFVSVLLIPSLHLSPPPLFSSCGCQM